MSLKNSTIAGSPKAKIGPIFKSSNWSYYIACSTDTVSATIFPSNMILSTNVNNRLEMCQKTTFGPADLWGFAIHACHACNYRSTTHHWIRSSWGVVSAEQTRTAATKRSPFSMTCPHCSHTRSTKCLDSRDPEGWILYYQTALCWSCGECKTVWMRPNNDDPKCSKCGYLWDQACEKVWRRMEIRICDGLPTFMGRDSVWLKGDDEV